MNSENRIALQQPAFMLIENETYYHVGSGWFVCFQCSGGYVANKTNMVKHIRSNHLNMDYGKFKDFPDAQNLQVTIEGLKEVKGLKCSMCHSVSGNQNVLSFRQKHIAKNPLCVGAKFEVCKGQIRGNVFYETAIEEPIEVSELATKFKNYNVKFNAMPILTSSTNPYQKFFGVFNEDVFGRYLQFEEIQINFAEYSVDFEAMSKWFRNYLESSANDLFHCNIIRLKLGTGRTLYNFAKTVETFKKISIFWANTCLVAAYSEAKVYKLSPQIREKARLFIDLQTVSNFNAFFDSLIDCGQRKLSCNWHDFFIIRYCFLSKFKRDGSFDIPSTITKPFSFVEYTFKIKIGLLLKDVRTNDLTSIESILTDYTQNEVFNHIITIHGQLKTLNNLTQGNECTIHATINPDVIRIENMEVSFTDNIIPVIRSVYDNILKMWISIMKNIPVIAIPPNIREDYQNMQAEYSFLNDPRNESFQFQNYVCSHQDFVKFDLLSDSLKTVWLEQVEKFTLNLVLLIQLTVGIPPRATETVSCLMYNCPVNGKRNFYVSGNQIFVSLIYKKTMMNTFNFTPIVRFLPPNVSNLLFSYMTLMRPLYNVVSYNLLPNFSPSKLLYNGSVEAFRDSFRSIFASSLGLSIGVAYYRHIAIHFMRETLSTRFASDLSLTEKIQNILSDLAAHSNQTDVQNYALTSLTSSFRLPKADLLNVQKACSLWHSLINMDQEVSPYIPRAKPQGNVSLEHVACRDSKEDAVMNLSTIDLLDHLKEKTGFETFKSIHQYAACLHSAESDKDLFICLPTGHGKSLIYLLPALIRPGKTIILILPLISIIRGVFQVAEKMGIACSLFSENSERFSTIVVVHYGIGASDFTRLKQAIGRNFETVHGIYFDEAHLLNTWKELMNTEKFYQLRGNLGLNYAPIKYVFMSATLTRSHMEKIKMKWSLDKVDTIIHYEQKPKVSYSFNCFATQAEKLDYLKLILPLKNEKTMVFFTCKESMLQAKEFLYLAGISVLCFHGSLSADEKNYILNQFESSKSALNILLTTTALCAGYDNHNISFVIVMGTLYELDNVYQAFGRGGRKNTDCKCFFLLTEDEMNGSEILVKFKNNCFRKIISDHLGTLSITCDTLSNYFLCLFCQNKQSRSVSRAICVKKRKASEHEFDRLRTLSQATLTEVNQEDPQKMSSKERMGDSISAEDNSFLAGYDDASKSVLNERANQQKVYTDIKIYADKIAASCFICFFKNLNHHHSPCLNGKYCWRCLSVEHFDPKSCPDKITVNGICYICYLPLKMHNAFEMNSNVGGNCLWKSTALKDALKYWLISIQKHPDSNLHKDIRIVAGSNLVQGYSKNNGSNCLPILKIIHSYLF